MVRGKANREPLSVVRVLSPAGDGGVTTKGFMEAIDGNYRFEEPFGQCGNEIHAEQSIADRLGEIRMHTFEVALQRQIQGPF
jgi:hypothetical protein